MSEKKKPSKDKYHKETSLEVINIINKFFVTSSDSIATIYPSGKIKTINPALEKFLGYKAADVIGKNIKLVFAKDSEQVLIDLLSDYINKGKLRAISNVREVKLITKNKLKHYARLSINEIALQDEQLLTFTFRDISDIKEVINELQHSENSLNAVFEASPDAVITIDEKCLIQRVNSSALKLFGYSFEELHNRNVNVLMPPPYNEEHDGYIAKYLKTGQKKIIGIGREVQAVRKNGERFPMLLFVSEYKLDGKSYFTGIIHDITEIKEKEKMLEITNKSLKNKNWIQDRVIRINEETRDIYKLDKLCNKIISVLATNIGACTGVLYLAADDYLEWKSGFAYSNSKKVKIKFGEGILGQVAVDKKIFFYKTPKKHMTLSSSIINVKPKEIVALPLVYSDGVIGVIELASLTEFDELQKTYLKNTAENIAMILNSALSRIRVNELLNTTQKQSQKMQLQQEEVQTKNQELEEKNQELQAQQEEIEATNEELEEQRCHLEEQKEKLEEANLDLQATQNLLSEKAKTLEVSSRYKSDFLANVSHELRTPLNSIIILSQLLSENSKGTLSEKDVEFAKTIYLSGNDLLNLINDILDLSKIEAGEMQVSVEQLSIKETVHYLEKMFMPMMNKKGIAFKTSIATSIPDTINTDKSRLEQILKNLLSNALKYTEKGSIQLTIKRPESKIQGLPDSVDRRKSISFVVEDTGIGIADEKQKLIFDAFKQIDSSLSKKYAGTGLGLSVSKGFAELLNGDIYLESKLNVGSKFTLVIPEEYVEKETYEKSEDEITSDLSQIQTNISTNSEHIKDDREIIQRSDYLILIVEDDFRFAKILYDQCQNMNFRAIHASDGETGLEMARSYSPNGIILDIRLPKMNGIDVLKGIKADSKIAHIPVHIMSVEEDGKKALKMGAIGFLQKPVESKKLTQALQSLEVIFSKNKGRVLLVEDDEVERNAVLKMLEGKRLDVTAVGSIKDAFKKLDNNNFDCIILDLVLKTGGSGFEFLRILSENPNYKSTPSIVYTGRDLSKKDQSMLESYSSSIIIKSAKSPDRLVEEVFLFLHKMESRLDNKKHKVVENVENRENMLNGKQILLVDDDARNIFSIQAMIDDKGCEVITASTGQEALDELKSHPDVDLVLMDIMMPEMDGFEAISRIRKQKRFYELPIIALTAKAMKGDREKCLEVGATDYLSKPIDVKQLLALLRIWLIQ